MSEIIANDNPEKFESLVIMSLPTSQRVANAQLIINYEHKIIKFCILWPLAKEKALHAKIRILNSATHAVSQILKYPMLYILALRLIQIFHGNNTGNVFVTKSVKS